MHYRLLADTDFACNSDLERSIAENDTTQDFIATASNAFLGAEVDHDAKRDDDSTVSDTE